MSEWIVKSIEHLLDFSNILNASIAASWMVLAVIVLRFLLKKAPRWIHVALWGLVAVRLLLPFSIESSLSLIPSAETIPHELLRVEGVQLQEPAYLDVVSNPIFTNGASVEIGQTIDRVQINMMLMTLIWLIGIAVLLVYTIISYWCLRRKVSEAVILRDNIFQSENAGSPFVLGIIKPRIYLPYKIEEQTLVHVIAHEQAHIQRKDHWWKPLGFLLLTIHWFNPLMWLGYVLLCRDIELACDEKVIKDIDNEQRANYSQALVACSVKRPMIAACPLAFGEVGVKERVKSVLNYKKPAFWIIIVAVVACVVVSVCFLTNPRTVFTIDRANVEKVTYYNQFVGDDCQGELNSAQVEEMVGRFSAVSKVKRSKHYEGLTPGYQLCVFLKDGSFVYANGYNALDDDIEIIYNDKRYAVSDTEFASYLRNVCSAGDVSSAKERISKNQISVSDEIINNVPAAVLDYAKDYVSQETDSWNYGNFEDGIAVQHINKVTEAKITGITQINTGTAALDHSINMYLLEYRLLPEDQDSIVLAGGMRSEMIDGRGWLTEWGSTGQPYLLLLAEDDNWTRICVTNTDSIDFDYGTPEMLERYGDKYTAAAMELYGKSKTENLIYVQSAGSTIQPVLSFAYSEKWTKNGFLCVDGGPVLNELTEWSEATYLPALVYSEDFTVSYADKVSFRYVIPFDESKNQMDHLYDITELENLDPGRYFIGIVVNQEGDYIEQAKQSECTGWTCLFRLTVE